MPFRKLIRIVAVVLLTVVLSVTGIIAYNNACDKAALLMKQNDMIALNTVVHELDSLYVGLMDVCEYIKSSSGFHEKIRLLSDDSVSPGRKAAIYEQIRGILTIFAENNEPISSIYFVCGDRRTEIFTEYADISLLERPVSNEPALKIASDGQIPYYSFYADAINSDVYILLKKSIMKQILSEIPVILSDGDGELFIYGEKELIRHVAPDRIAAFASGDRNETRIGNVLLYRQMLKADGRSILFFRDASVQTREYRIILVIQLVAILLSSVLSFALSGVVSRRVVKQLKKIAGFFTAFDGKDKNTYPVKSRSIFTLRETIIAYFLLVVFVPTMAFVGIESAVLNRVLMRHKNEIYESMAVEAAKDVSRYLDNEKHQLLIVACDPYISQLVNSSNIGGDYAEIAYEMQKSIWKMEDQSFIEIRNRSDDLLYTSNSAQSVGTNKEKNQWSVREKSSGEHLVTITVPIRERLTGYATLADNLEWMMYKLFPETDRNMPRISLADKNGRYLNGLMQVDLSGKSKNEGGNTKIAAYPVEGTDWFTVIHFEETHTLQTIINAYADRIGYIAGVFLFILACAYAVSFSVMTPLNRICALSENFVPGDPSMRSDENVIVDEVGMIAKSYNEMADRIDRLIEEVCSSNNRNLIEENKRRRAEMLALQMQINPHFLLNAIATVSGIIASGEKDKACSLLSDIGTLFRTGISRDNPLAMVSEELEYTKSYVEIMSVRYPNVQFEWEIDPQVMCAQTIHLCLQPVIENAIYHGIDRTVVGGRIRICLKKEGEALVFSVADNGVGIEPDRLYEIRQELEDARLGKLIGICNVQARIRLQFGDAWGIRLESRAHEGTRVELHMPYKKMLKGEANNDRIQ